MDISIVTSLGAFVVSILSIAITIHFKLKEEAKIRAFSSLFLGDDEREPTIIVAAVNIGRRPIIVRMLVGMDDKKEWSGLYLGDDQQGVRLEENERFDRKLSSGDLGLSYDEIEIEFTELYFEDAIGKRWRVDRSRSHIVEFRGAYKKYCAAQERKREMHALVAKQVQAALRDQSS